MKNLLGRLHARSDSQRARIAALWRASVFGNDSAQHIGRIYQTMTDIRAVRDSWPRLSETQQSIIRSLVPEGSPPLTIIELAATIEQPEDLTREAAADLFFWGILAADSDANELPVGDLPKVFVPGELMHIFRRLLQEQSAVNLHTNPLRRLLEIRDDVELETTGTIWGLRVMPGFRKRSDLISDILDAVATPGRMEGVVSNLRQPASSIWSTMLQAEEPHPQPLAAIVEAAGLTVSEAPLALAVEHTSRLRSALEALESALLVNHIYLPDGSRALFVPDEIRNPRIIPNKVPLAAIQPLPVDSVPPPEPKHPFALAWDVMTVVRDIATQGPPVWIPGRALPTHWLRAINSRFWFRDESEPPPGYAATLLYLALGVGALEPAPRTQGMEKAAIKPMLGRNARWWRGLSFAEQTERLRQNWLGAETWIEGREAGTIEVRSADWVRFRHRLLTAIARLDLDEWVLVSEASLRLAEQDPQILGDYFEVATGRPETRNRVTAIALAIEVELTTAFSWFGFVTTQYLGELGIAMRVSEAAVRAAREIDAMPTSTDPITGPVLTVSHSGVVQLLRPAPIHIWSLTAFSDSEQLHPVAMYQLRPNSVGTALGAGFDLDQITSYLERQSGEPLPDPLVTTLREWTAGYKRVKMRRAVSLELDVQVGVAELRKTLVDGGFQLVATQGNIVMVMLPDTGEDAAEAERKLTTLLRKAGYVGLWMKSQELG